MHFLLFGLELVPATAWNKITPFIDFLSNETHHDIREIWLSESNRTIQENSESRTRHREKCNLPPPAGEVDAAPRVGGVDATELPPPFCAAIPLPGDEPEGDDTRIHLEQKVSTDSSFLGLTRSRSVIGEAQLMNDHCVKWKQQCKP